MHQDATCFYTRAGQTWGTENKSPKTWILPGQWIFSQYNPNKLVHKKPLHTSVHVSSDAKCKTFAVTCLTHIKKHRYRQFRSNLVQRDRMSLTPAQVTFSLMSCRSPGASGSVLRLRDLCWSGFPALPVRSALHHREGRQRAGVWGERGAESISQAAQGAHGGPLWRRHLRHLVLPSAHAVLQDKRHPQPLHSDSGDGRPRGGTSQQRPAQRRHLATQRLQPVRHS